MILQFDFSSDVPIYAQIRNQVVEGIANGDLEPGEKLPTIRSLASEAGINMMTVSKAYQLLKSEGYIETDRRQGAVVKLPTGVKKLTESSINQLSIIASEAKIAGMSESDFIEMCKQVYEKGSDGK